VRVGMGGFVSLAAEKGERVTRARGDGWRIANMRQHTEVCCPCAWGWADAERASSAGVGTVPSVRVSMYAHLRHR
jgi:hypothetical protein